MSGSQTDINRHPRGLYTLFFTEMWERFSYYGMRALLVLFMTDTIARGGLGLTDKIATAIYGLYTAGVYLAALPGGWIADRFIGARRSVWYGGIIIALGQFVLVIPDSRCFYLGLLAVIMGTGLLKPNISAMVGQLYPDGGARRDAGFTIFYMGINLGAFLSPLVTAALSQRFNWRYGFAAAGVGMLLGLVQFRLTARHLGNVGLHEGAKPPSRGDHLVLFGSLTALVVILALAFGGLIPINPLLLARGATAVILGVALLYFLACFSVFGLSSGEKKRVGVIAILFLASAMFWSGFEQAGSSLNLFAERYTDRFISWFGQEIPAGWFQSLGPLFVISFAPVFAWMWVRLSRRGLDPSLPAKFALGLLLLAAGFLVMAVASKSVGEDQKVLPTWLIATYLVHTFAELCVSPVGLSSVTQLSPKRLVGQMMGIWFLATSFGNLLAGLIAGTFGDDSATQMSGRYLQIVLTTAGAGILLLFFVKPIKRLAGMDSVSGRE